MITTEPQIRELVATLTRSPWLALDTEADSLHSYPEKLCLIQLSHAGGDELVDPLTVPNLAPLLEHLAGREVVLHGASFDLRILRREHGFVAKQVFDTEIAARLLGRPHAGLRDLASELLGVTLEKGSQRANWSMRPLTPKMIEYAHGDTRHLRALREALEAELVRLGRLEWHQECCARLVATSIPTPPDPAHDWRIKNSSHLSRRALAVLRELWLWREARAVAKNRPPYFVLSHELMVDVAKRGGAQAQGVVELPPAVPPAVRSDLQAAIERARTVPESDLPRQELPERPPRLSNEVQARLDALRAKRDKQAEKLGIEPTLIATKADLQSLAEDLEAGLRGLMKWQAALLR